MQLRCRKHRMNIFIPRTQNRNSQFPAQLACHDGSSNGYEHRQSLTASTLDSFPAKHHFPAGQQSCLPCPRPDLIASDWEISKRALLYQGENLRLDCTRICVLIPHQKADLASSDAFSKHVQIGQISHRGFPQSVLCDAMCTSSGDRIHFAESSNSACFAA